MGDPKKGPGEGHAWPFLAGVVTGVAGALLAKAVLPRRLLDASLVPGSREDPDLAPTVLIPGILGNELLRPDGSSAWLNLGNVVGSHDVRLPYTLPFADSRDQLVPGGLLGADTVVPRWFGFTEYADLLKLLRAAGFRREGASLGAGAAFTVFAYDWRRDLAETACRLGEFLEALADARGDREARFNLVGHSMGGLIARYYLRFGAKPLGGEAPVTWAGARRVSTLVLGATPNAGAIPALDTLLNGARVGLSVATLSPAVVAGMPSLYQMLPPAAAPALVAPNGEPIGADLHDIATWERFGWGPFAPTRRAGDLSEAPLDREAHREFVTAALGHARGLHGALARKPQVACPARVVALGGDCLPTLGRALVQERPGTAPRFEAWTRAEAAAMLEAGDGRVTRSSLLGSHLAGTGEAEGAPGIPEIGQAFLGDADHHGLYADRAVQSLLLRLLLRPVRRSAAPRFAPSGAAR